MPDNALSPSNRRRKVRESIETRLISEPLRSKVERDLKEQGAAGPSLSASVYEVIFEINQLNVLGRSHARDVIYMLLGDVLGQDIGKSLSLNMPGATHPYVFARLTAAEVLRVAEADRVQASSSNPISAETAANAAAKVYEVLSASRTSSTDAKPYTSSVPTSTEPARTAEDTRRTKTSEREDAAKAGPSEGTTSPPSRDITTAHRAIFRIWESQKVHPLCTESIQTVKARPAHYSFGALGEGVVWAILDSGIDKTHPHFATFDNLNLAAPLTGKSCSFKPNLPWDQDEFGHGTHVAGIVCGQAADDPGPVAALQEEESSGGRSFHLQPVPGIRGMAPKAKILILRVLDNEGNGTEADLIQAIEYIQQLNDFGRHVVVHGANISVGLFSDPTWYGCGQTPLCREINRLVKSGVTVVVAAGNTGFGATLQLDNSTAQAGQPLSINDPGNADLAITVGSTHRSSPHTFGVSYFSSKGPTSDGRSKPDVVAPGEKIISAASSQRAARETLEGLQSSDRFGYIEDTGTSMAAPHVSGLLAAFLSVKREYLGEAEKIRTLLMQSATDLGRDKSFQGAGLVNLLNLIQSV